MSAISDSVGGILEELDRDIQSVFEPAVVQLLESVNQFLERAETDIGRVETTFDEGADVLVGATESMTELVASIRERLEGVFAALREANQQVEQATSGWDDTSASQFDQSWQRTDELYQGIAEHTTQLTDNHEAIRSQVSTWVGEVRDALSELGQLADGTSADFDAFEQQNTERFEQLAQAFDQLQREFDQQFDSIDQNVVQMTERTVAEAEQFLHQTAEHLEQGASLVSGGLRMFGEEGERVAQVFDGGVGQVMGKVGDVMRILEAIKPFIELAKSI